MERTEATLQEVAIDGAFRFQVREKPEERES
jgi:hypothetical protein